MSDQPLLEPVPLSAGAFDPSLGHPLPAGRPQCRALTVDGHRCKNKVLGDLHLCYSHYRNRRPALAEPRYVSVPLLEDRSSIQLMTTEVLQGVLSHKLDPLRARVALSALRIAALTLPRLAPSRLAASPAAAPSPSGQADPADETVCRLARDHQDFISADGDLTSPPLNPSCSIPESVDAVRELLNTFEPQSHCDPAEERPEMPQCSPEHDLEHCPCFTCTDYRALHQELTQDLRAGTAWL